MAVKFVIDSASDVLPAEAQAMGVTHLPLKVIFGQEEFADGVTLSHEAFFEKLENAQQLPTTCQVPPADFEAAFENLVGQGHQVVAITLSSGLSGTYQSAMIAASDFEDQVFVVDSLTAAVGERVLLMRGLELAEEGLGAKEIAEILQQERHKIRLVAVLDTLEYLKKGGRISAATALAGGLLAIKPAIEVKDGKVSMAGTARGLKKANALLKELIQGYGINFEKPMALTCAGSDRLLQGFIQDSQDLWEGRQALPVYSLGCTIGTHVGPGAYGIAFFEK